MVVQRKLFNNKLGIRDLYKKKWLGGNYIGARETKRKQCYLEDC